MTIGFWDVLNDALAIGRSEGYIARRIRIHPAEYDQITEMMKRLGAVVEWAGIAETLYGIELVKDESCVEGPKIDWVEPLTQDKIDTLHRLIAGMTQGADKGQTP